MLSDRIGALLTSTRKQLKLSRTELARRGGVSTRLLAELERGQRPHVSLETALRLLRAVGVSVHLTAPHGEVVGIRDASAAALARAARATRRRQTWTGRHVHLHDEGDDPGPGRSTAQRVAAVSQVSKQAFGIAAAAGRQAQRPVAARTSSRRSSSPSDRPAAGARPAPPRTTR